MWDELPAGVQGVGIAAVGLFAVWLSLVAARLLWKAVERFMGWDYD